MANTVIILDNQDRFALATFGLLRPLVLQVEFNGRDRFLAERHDPLAAHRAQPAKRQRMPVEDRDQPCVARQRRQQAFDARGMWGALSTWQDSAGTQWVLAPFWGPVSKEFTPPVQYGRPTGGGVRGTAALAVDWRLAPIPFSVGNSDT